MRAATAAWLAPYAVLAAAVAHGLWYSWLCWGDPVVDCGRELEVARLVSEGGVLYRDVRHYYGPLAPYLNGGLFAIFGARAGVLMAAGVLSVLLMIVAVYALARRLSDRLAATVAAIAFVHLCAFAHLYFNGIFNWVMPYTYSATYGMLAATASLLLLVRNLQEGRPADLWLSVACLVLAAFSKIELLVPTLCAHAVFVVSVRPRPSAYVAGIGAGVAIAGVLMLAVGPRLVDDYFRFALTPRFRPILFLHSGLAFWQQALEAVGRSALAFAGVLALVAAAARLDQSRWMPAWGHALGAVTCAAAAWFALWRLSFFDQLRALPLVLGAALVAAVVHWRQAPAERTRLASVLLLVFSLGCLARVPLAAGAFHFGFYLLPVPLVALAVLWFHDLPRYLPGRPRQASMAAGLGLFAALTVTHYRVSRDMYEAHNSIVRGPRGTMHVLDGVNGFPEGAAYADTVRLLAQYPPETRVLAVPEGAGLGFLAGLRSVCGMHSFKPPEMDDLFEDRLLACLETTPPDLVVRVNVNLEEFGSRGFGVDYAQHVDAWIRTNYRPVAAFGPGGHVLVLRR